MTGLCRSGSAAIAEVCHHLGYAMGRTFAAPTAPDFRFDFEDADVTNWMATNVEMGLHPLANMDLPALIRARLEHARVYGFGSNIGFKSPLFAIDGAVDELRAALVAAGYETNVITSVRDPASIERSISRQPGAETLRLWNSMIPADREGCALVRDGEHLISIQGHKVRYEDLVADPAMVVPLLASALGVEDPVAVARAVARVARPCS